MTPALVGKALKGLESLQDLGEVSEKLSPMLEHAEQLSRKLDKAYIVLKEVYADRLALRQEVELQRQITLRMFVDLGGMTLQDVLAKEQIITERLLEETAPLIPGGLGVKEQGNADTTTRTESNDSEEIYPSP
jgi:hypothetical protein